MGTSNFHNRNAKHVYAIGTEYDDALDSERLSLENDEMVENVKYALRDKFDKGLPSEQWEHFNGVIKDRQVGDALSSFPSSVVYIVDAKTNY